MNSRFLAVALLFSPVGSWAVDADTPCIAQKDRRLELTQRRSGKEMLEFRQDLSRQAMVQDLHHALADASPEDKKRINTWLAQLNEARQDSTLSKIAGELSQIEERSRKAPPVVKPYAQVDREMGGAGIQIKKRDYLGFVRALVSLLDIDGIPTAGLGEKLAADSSALTEVFPGSRVFECADTILIYETKASEKGLSTESSVGLGNVTGQFKK